MTSKNLPLSTRQRYHQILKENTCTFEFSFHQSDTFRPIVLPLVVAGAVLVGLFIWWRQCGCCSWCCCSCLKPRGTAQCGACGTCPYVIEVTIRLSRDHTIVMFNVTIHPSHGHTIMLQGPVLRTEKKCCSHLCSDPRKMTYLKFRESCQSDCVVFCVHCDK